MKESVYIDSNIFLYPVLYDEEFHVKVKNARKVLIDVSEGRLRAATSSLTWDEVIWVIRKIYNAKLAMEKGRQFLNFPNLNILKIDVKVLFVAQNLVEKYSLKPRDAIHVASALSNNIKTIISDDKDFDRVEEIRRVPLENMTF